MSIYLRKSLRAGPLRFNLSKSGVGVSGGIKGLRLGTGPRGNYVHMGRGGVYYRASLNGNQSRTPSSPNASAPDPAGPPIPMDTVGPMREIESGSVTQMVDSSSQALLAEINAKQKMIRYLPLVLGCTALGLGMTVVAGLPLWTTIGILAIGVIGAVWATIKDALRRTVVLFYDFESAQENAYETVHSAFRTLCSCQKLWHVSAEGDIRDSKYHAGASTAIKRNPIRPFFQGPARVKTNISIPSIPVGRQTLYFFPDRLLVSDRGRTGAVPYSELEVGTSTIPFVEQEAVPRDSRIVDRTWRYVNKHGGPDKRFRDNFEIPVVEYGVLHFTSGSGLNEMIQTSRTDVGEDIGRALVALAQTKEVAPPEGQSTSNPTEGLSFPCPNCGHQIRTKVQLAGQFGRCPMCKEKVQAPTV